MSNDTQVSTPLSLVGVLIVSVLTALVTLLTTLAGTTGALNHMERASPLLTSLVFGLATIAIGLTAFGSYFSSLVKDGTDPTAKLLADQQAVDAQELSIAAPAASLSAPWQAAWKARSARKSAARKASDAAARKGQPEAAPLARAAQKSALEAAGYAAEVSLFIENLAESPDQAGNAGDANNAKSLGQIALQESALANQWAENARISALAAPPRQPSIDRPKRDNIGRVSWQVVKWLWYCIVYPLRAFIHLWRRSDWQSLATICFRYGLLLFVLALIGGASLAGWSATTPATPALNLSQDASTGVVSGSAHAGGMRPQDELVTCLVFESTDEVLYADSSGPDAAGDAADSFSIPKKALNGTGMLTSLAFAYNSRGPSADNLCQGFSDLHITRYSSAKLGLSS